MARIVVHGADVSNGQLIELRVRMDNLPARTISRETVVAWLRDGHSLIVAQTGVPLFLLERLSGDELAYVIRLDHAAESGDDLTGLPAVHGAEL